MFTHLNHMKKIITAVLVMLIFIPAFSQKKQNALKIAGNAALPIGTFGENFNAGWGIHLTYYYSVNEGGSVLASAGLDRWHAKNSDITGGLSQYKIGYRQFVSKGFYLNGDLGIANYLGIWGNGSKFTYSGGTGYLIKTKGNGGVDIHARISAVPTRSWISLGAGYQFGL
jgi:hypothetical protein